MFSIEELYLAYNDCIKHKRSSKDYLEYILDYGESDLFDLLLEINTKTYTIKPSTCFVATYPKLREIFAANFRDRIVHHLVVNAIEPYFEKRFISWVYSCRVGKWNIAWVKKLFWIVKWLSNKENFYYLQMDIKSFFMSIDKNILFNIFKKTLPKINHKNQDLILYLLEVIIFNDPTIKAKKVWKEDIFSSIPEQKTLFKIPKNCWLPIWNLTSQFFANIYLNEFDQFIKRKLQVKYYFRYVDDFILIWKKEELLDIKDKIIDFLQNNLKLQIANGKTKFLPINYDIDFIWYVIKDKSFILPRKRNINAFKQVIYKKDYKNEENISKTFSSINSYFGILKHSNSFDLRKKLSFQVQDGCIMKKNDDFLKINLDKSIYNILNSDKKTMQKYKEIKNQFKHHIIFIQIWCFYKSFDNEAIFVSPKLGLNLTLFNPKTKAEAIMCGFHEKYLDKYLEKLNTLKINYVILKQLRDESWNITREVSQIKLFDEKFTIPISKLEKINEIKKNYYDKKIKKDIIYLWKQDNFDLSKEQEFIEVFKNMDFLKMNSYEILSFVYNWKNILAKKRD